MSTSLVDRIRKMLNAEDTREVAMFGGRASMVDDKMVVCVLRDENLLLRVDPERSDALLATTAAQRSEMGTGRRMSKSWLTVSTDAIGTEADLRFWIDIALQYNAIAGQVK